RASFYPRTSPDWTADSFVSMVGIVEGTLMVGYGWLLTCGLLCALSPVTAGAQAPSPSTPNGAAATGASDSPTTTFHTKANLVLVDVVVRDKGKPVQGLKAADFEVLEDEKARAVTTFEEHTATDAIKASEPPQLPP